jgi:hypothetical protein
MSTSHCGHCHCPITFSAESPAGGMTCPRCGKEAELPRWQGQRWYVAHQEKKYGPISWQRLLTLAARGDLDPEVMLYKEGSTRWVRASTLRALFASAPAPVTTTALPERPALPKRAKPPAPPAPRPAPASPPVKPAAPPVGQEIQALFAYINAVEAIIEAPPSVEAPAPAPAPSVRIDAAAPSPQPPHVREPEPMSARTEPIPEPETAEAAVEGLPVAAATTPDIEPSPSMASLTAFDRELLRSLVESSPPLPAPPAPAPPVIEPPAVQVSHAEPVAVPAQLPKRGGVPWLMEGLTAASLSVLLALSLILGMFVIEWIKPTALPEAGTGEIIQSTVAQDSGTGR